MMLRVLLIVGAAATLVFIALNIRKSQIKTSDTVFWFVFVLCLLILALFPQVAFVLSDFFDIQSPSNFVFLSIVAVLLIKEFTASLEIARLRSKVTYLVQEVALMQRNDGEKPKGEER